MAASLLRGDSITAANPVASLITVLKELPYGTSQQNYKLQHSRVIMYIIFGNRHAQPCHACSLVEPLVHARFLQHQALGAMEAGRCLDTLGNGLAGGGSVPSSPSKYVKNFW
jgi:hypothetical protein